MLDTIKIIETPEGVELKLTCAGIYVRGLAWLIDALIHTIILIVLSLILPRFGNFGMGLFAIIFFLLNWLYPVLFEIYYNGQTPGKKIMKIQVLLMDGTQVTWGASLLRNLLRTVDILPFSYAFGVLTMLMSHDFRRLGDLAANTIVIYKRELPYKKPIKTITAHGPKVVLSIKEQQMIINYAERLDSFSPARAEELALLAIPLMIDLNQHESPSASEQILAIANYLVGRR
jgi:uncharacterized RDD family membrane protein YckC